jgi:hypothetical protein
MTMSRDKEQWAMALWVEKHHGADGPAYIADQIARLATENEPDGVSLWLRVAERYDQLLERDALRHVRS